MDCNNVRVRYCLCALVVSIRRFRRTLWPSRLFSKDGSKGISIAELKMSMSFPMVLCRAYFVGRAAGLVSHRKNSCLHKPTFVAEGKPYSALRVLPDIFQQASYSLREVRSVGQRLRTSESRLQPIQGQVQIKLPCKLVSMRTRSLDGSKPTSIAATE